MKFTASITSVDPVAQFSMCILHSVTSAHVLHLSTRSYAVHKALEDYYTAAGDLIDSFVEAYQGRYGLVSGLPAGYEVPDAALAYITYLKTETETLRRKPNFPQDAELQNIVDEVAGLIDSTLYKLKFLT
jgi:hypothetical protein